jgi:hypothetical protein
MNGSLVRNIPAVVEVAQVVFVAAGARGSNVTLVPAAPGTSGLPGALDMPGLVAFTSAQGQPYLCLPDLPRDDLTGLTGPPRRWVDLATLQRLETLSLGHVGRWAWLFKGTRNLTDCSSQHFQGLESVLAPYHQY